MAAEPACVWNHHNYKHFAPRGATARYTLNNNPALYLPDASGEDIRVLETATTRTPDLHRGEVGRRVRYLRDAGRVIGWDEGQDAVLSYVECSSGAYHGRPIHADNHVTRAMRSGVER